MKYCFQNQKKLWPCILAAAVLLTGCGNRSVSGDGAGTDEGTDVVEGQSLETHDTKQETAEYIETVNFVNAAETLWSCEGIEMDHVAAKGDYVRELLWQESQEAQMLKSRDGILEHSGKRRCNLCSPNMTVSVRSGQRPPQS